MLDDIETVKKFYDDAPEKEWERLERHPFEFLLTTHMMDKYVRPGDRILDIGGGPGRYAIHYAQKGCDVTLVDLSEGNVRFAREKAAETGVSIRAILCNCLNIGDLRFRDFDHVFLMGPLYHLTSEEARKRAVTLALSALKPGGVFYASFIMLFAGVIYDLKSGPGLLPADLDNPLTRPLFDSVVEGKNYEGPAFTAACFMHQRQIEPFMKPFGLIKLHMFGQEGILAPNEYQILSYPKEEQAMWVETAKRFLEIPELLSYSEHAMYIGQKPE